MAATRKTNILYIAHDIGLIGGAERQLLELLRGLDRERFRPYLVCLERGGPVGRGAEEMGVRVAAFPRRWRWDLGVITRLFGIIKRGNIAIVHAYLGLPGFYGAAAAKLAGSKAITTIRIAGPRARIAEASERLAFLISDRIIANSRAGVDYYFRRFPGRKKTTVIYNGYDLADFDMNTTKARAELGLPADGAIIGHVANLTYLKDYPTFLRALAIVFGRRDDVSAVIAGDGRKRPEYETLARDLGIAQRTHFLGHRRDVLDLVKHFDMGVLASHPDYSEGLSNSICEYMGLGRPVVATAVGGNTELVNDGVTGLLAAPGDPDDLAAKMLMLLKDENMRRSMGEKGRAFFVDNLSLETMVSRTEGVYAELIRT